MYKVKAYRSGIYSSTSTGVTGMKLKDSISFSLTKPSYRKINISISHLSTATKYYIYRATSKSGSYSLIATIDATGETLNYLDTVSFNKTYYYKVKASNGVNTTATTSYKYITSNTMDKPVITSVSNNRYQNTIISWNKVNGATSYNVYRCSSTGSDCEKIANTKSTSYTTTGGSEGVTYMYKVKPYVGSTAGITSTGVTGMKLKDSISFSVTKPSYRKINISISHLSTAKKYYIYLAYLHQMEELDLEVASSFLVMAANLLAIKARMLLPKPPVEEEEEDARAELVHDILEYMRFKDAAETLGGLKEQHSLFIARPNEADMYEKLFADQVILEDKTLVDLTNAFAAILRQVEERGEVIDIAKEQVTVRDKLLQLYESLSANPQGQSFESFFAASASRIEVIVTFLAMLELSRRGILRVSQSSEYGRIYLYPAELERFAELGLANADLGEY